jgi:hypothetical protein
MRAVAAEAADIVALGWSQQLQPGRARVIRRLLADSDIPILMLPTAANGTPTGVDQAGSDVWAPAPR